MRVGFWAGDTIIAAGTDGVDVIIIARIGELYCRGVVVSIAFVFSGVLCELAALYASQAERFPLVVVAAPERSSLRSWFRTSLSIARRSSSVSADETISSYFSRAIAIILPLGK